VIPYWLRPWSLAHGALCHTPVLTRLLPSRLVDWLCDRYDLALGVTRAELRNRKATER